MGLTGGGEEDKDPAKKGGGGMTGRSYALKRKEGCGTIRAGGGYCKNVRERKKEWQAIIGGERLPLKINLASLDKELRRTLLRGGVRDRENGRGIHGAWARDEL